MEQTRRYRAVAVAVVALLGGAEARAEVVDGLRFSMGFLGGGRDYRRVGFALESGEGPGAAGLGEPFQRAPYAGVLAPGVTWDARLVLSHLRMTVGFDLPFPSFDGASLAGRYVVGGAETDVIPRAITSRQVRFGLGGEVPVGEKLAVFVDLYGTVDWLTTELSVGGVPAKYAATGFGFSLSAGVQWQLRDFFFVFASAEGGLGPVVWNGRCGVGFNTY